MKNRDASSVPVGIMRVARGRGLYLNIGRTKMIWNRENSNRIMPANITNVPTNVFGEKISHIPKANRKTSEIVVSVVVNLGLTTLLLPR